MLDHIGFPVSDLARSKAFYSAALAPLGIRVVYRDLAEKSPAATPSPGSARSSRASGSAPARR